LKKGKFKDFSFLIPLYRKPSVKVSEADETPLHLRLRELKVLSTYPLFEKPSVKKIRTTQKSRGQTIGNKYTV